MIHTLKVARVSKGYTQGQLAEICGISEPTIVTAERGRTYPYPTTRKKIEQELGKIDWDRTYTEGFIRH